MSDQVDIGIRTTADTSGARQTAAELDRVTQATDRHSEAQRRNTREGGAANEQLRNVRTSLRGLALELPIVGRLLEVMFNPVGAAAAVAVGAFSLVKRELDRFNTAINDTEWAGYKSGASSAAGELLKIRDLAKEAADHSQRLTDVFRARQSAEERLDEARMKLELAQAEDTKDPAEKLRRKYEIEERYATRAYQREERNRIFKISEQDRRAAELRQTEAALGTRLAGKKAEAKSLGSPEEIEARIATDEARLKSVTAEAMKAADEVARLQEQRAAWEVAPRGFGPKGDFPQQALLDTAIGNLTTLGVTGDSLRANLARDRARLPRARTLPKEIETLQGRFDEVQGARSGVEAMLPTQTAVAGIESMAAGQALALGSRTRAQAALNATVQAKEKEDEAIAQAILKLGTAFNKNTRASEQLSRLAEQLEQRVQNLENREAYSRSR